MKLLLKSIVFGIVLTAILSAAAFGLVMAVVFLEKLGGAYPLILIFVLVCFTCSTAYYYGNK